MSLIKFTLTLMSGSVIAQAITFAAMPVLSRLYSPSDFGVFAFYMSTVSLLCIIASGRYEMAVVLPKKRTTALNVLFLSLVVTSITCLLYLVLTLLFNKEIIRAIGPTTNSNWIFFIPFSVWLLNFYQTLSYWWTRKNSYKVQAISRIGKSGVNVVVNIAIVFSLGSLAGLGLVWSNVIALLAALFILLQEFYRVERDWGRGVSLRRMLILAVKYKNFPFLNSPHALINALKEIMVNFIILMKATGDALGAYYFMISVMRVPVGIVGSALAQVYYSEATSIYNSGRSIRKFTMKLLSILALLGMIPAFLSYQFAQPVFIIVFGESWEIAGTYAKFITPYIYMHFIASPLGMVPLIVSRQKTALLWGSLESVLFVAVFWFGLTIEEGMITTIKLLSIVFCFYFSIYFIWIFKISGGSK